jgi:hypothetical protein
MFVFGLIRVDSENSWFKCPSLGHPSRAGSFVFPASLGCQPLGFSMGAAAPSTPLGLGQIAEMHRKPSPFKDQQRSSANGIFLTTTERGAGAR